MADKNELKTVINKGLEKKKINGLIIAVSDYVKKDLKKDAKIAKFIKGEENATKLSSAISSVIENNCEKDEVHNVKLTEEQKGIIADEMINLIANINEVKQISLSYDSEDRTKMKADNEEYKKKVKKLEEEYNEVSVRVVALETFLRSDDWFKMDKKEKELVDKQKEYSTKYADILRERMSFYKDKIF